MIGAGFSCMLTSIASAVYVVIGFAAPQVVRNSIPIILLLLLVLVAVSIKEMRRHRRD